MGKERGGAEHGPFDLVVDASGLRSALRTVHAELRLDRPNPYGALWGVVAEPPDWPHRHQLRQCYDGASVMVGVLPIGRRPGDNRQLAAFFWSLRVADFTAWRDADFGAWQERVTTLWPDVRPFVTQFAAATDLALAVYADTVLARPWIERLVFIGDAARTASPQLGQGANLALIDAMTLAACLEVHATLPVALDTYARTRLAHSRFYGLASRWLTPFFQSDSRAAGLIRDLAFGPMRHVPYLRAEMARTLAGVKTGLFTQLDPGDWHERYRNGA